MWAIRWRCWLLYPQSKSTCFATPCAESVTWAHGRRRLEGDGPAEENPSSGGNRKSASEGGQARYPFLEAFPRPAFSEAFRKFVF